MVLVMVTGGVGDGGDCDVNENGCCGNVWWRREGWWLWATCNALIEVVGVKEVFILQEIFGH